MLTVCIPANNCVSPTIGNVPNHFTSPVIAAGRSSDIQTRFCSTLLIVVAAYSQASVGILTLSPTSTENGMDSLMQGRETRTGLCSVIAIAIAKLSVDVASYYVHLYAIRQPEI